MMKQQRAAVKPKLTATTTAPERRMWHGHGRKDALQEMRRQIQAMREEIKRAKRAANPR
jgi:hypothetical protein